MHTRFAIVGGGLAGVSLATRLHIAGQDVHLFEARHRFGGRIKTHVYDGTHFDLGPSWYWPGQPRMARLVQDLGLTTFDQYAEGAVSYEDEAGQVFRDQGFSSMQGSWRIEGGMTGLINGLLQRLPKSSCHTDHPVRAVSKDGTITFADGVTHTADHIILALPPRVAATLIYEPELGPDVRHALQQVPTWMGGHAKFLALYDRPFWRESGLSGDAMSRKGPLVEIHDASAKAGTGPAALFGFLGVPATHRKGQTAALREASIDQLTRLFGPDAAKPVDTAYHDWAFAPETAVPSDQAPLTHHPSYGMPAELRSVWGPRLTFCVTELAPEMGGYLEGALSAAATTAQELLEAVGA